MLFLVALGARSRALAVRSPAAAAQRALVHDPGPPRHVRRRLRSYWCNLWEHRHSIPVSIPLRGLTASAVAVSAGRARAPRPSVWTRCSSPPRAAPSPPPIVVLAPGPGRGASPGSSAHARRPRRGRRRCRRSPCVPAAGSSCSEWTASPSRLLAGRRWSAGAQPVFARLLEARAHMARWPPCGPPRPRRSGPPSSPVACPATTASRASRPTACAAPGSVYELLPSFAFVSLLERDGPRHHGPRHLARTAGRRRSGRPRRAFGIPSGFVRMWGTFPAERVQGFLLSNYFHLLRGDPARAAGHALPARPAPGGRRPARFGPRSVDHGLLLEFVDASAADDALPLAAGARGARPRPRPHLPACGRGAALGLRPAVLRDLRLRPGRGGPRLPALRRARPFRRRASPRRSAATVASSTATSPWWGSGSSRRSGPRARRRAGRGLGLRHGARAALAAPLLARGSAAAPTRTLPTD